VGVLNLARRAVLPCLQTGRSLSCINGFQASPAQALQTDIVTLLRGGDEPSPPLQLGNGDPGKRRPNIWGSGLLRTPQLAPRNLCLPVVLSERCRHCKMVRRDLREGRKDAELLPLELMDTFLSKRCPLTGAPSPSCPWVGSTGCLLP